MIDIHIQAETAKEALDELHVLGTMANERYALLCARSLEANQKLDVADEDIEQLMNQVSDLEQQLAAARHKIDEQDVQLNAKDVRIAALEKKLAEVEAPQQAEPTEGDTEPSEEEQADPEPAEGDTEPAPAEDEQTDIPEVTEAPVKEYKKEEVRAVLVKCRAANIAITDILAPYGGSLGAVKKEDYAKVVEAAEKALEGK